jgi:hypothetical protein
MNLIRGRRHTHLTGHRPNVEGLPITEDVRQEIEAHIELRTDELMAAGWEPEAARREALRLFGDPADVGQRSRKIARRHDRQIRARDHLGAIARDVHFSLRLLHRSPLFATIAILSLAIGIGANAAVFSLVDSVLLRPLPYPESERLVRVWPEQVFSKGVYQRAGQSLSSLAGVAGYRTGMFTLSGNGPAEEAVGAVVTTNHFEVLGVRPLLGRLFGPRESEPGSARSIILSYALCHRRCHAARLSAPDRELAAMGRGKDRPVELQ